MCVSMCVFVYVSACGVVCVCVCSRNFQILRVFSSRFGEAVISSVPIRLSQDRLPIFSPSQGLSPLPELS